jgi:hypothetical protein
MLQLQQQQGHIAESVGCNRPVACSVERPGSNELCCTINLLDIILSLVASGMKTKVVVYFIYPTILVDFLI